jgi:branched-chain amino acid transport system ATP-binding protein
MLTTVDLVKHFGGLCATDGVSLNIDQGEIHALIGPNGAGKTTLVGQLTGCIPSDSGRVFFGGKDITTLPTYRRAHLGLVRSFQISSIFPDITVLDNVSLAVQVHQGHSFRFWRDARTDRGLRQAAHLVLEQVGLALYADATAAELSHGAQRQLEIAMAIASAPKMLLLDEPMAGLGPDESRRMVSLLRQLKERITILLVEHDMDAVFALSDRITVMVYGRVIATGRPPEISANEEVRRAYLGDQGLVQ